MDERDEVIMDSLGRLAGIAAFILMMARLSRLIESGPSTPAWHLIMAASAFLGGVVWWLLAQTVSNKRLVVGLFAAGGIILFLRIASPGGLLAGFIPTPDTMDVLAREVGQAVDVIRFGIAPVVPTAGVLAILAVLMWLFGGLFVWGSSDGPVIAAVLPSFGLYLEFAVMDRRRSTAVWLIAASVVLIFGTVAVTMERRNEAGRVRNEDGRPVPRQTKAASFVLATVVALGAIAATGAAAPLVPTFGNLRLGLGNGYGQGYGGVSFNRLADLQQRLISRTNQVMFTAVLDESAPPASQVYWRMESLDSFDGIAWRPAGTTTGFFQPGQAGGNRDYAYQGTVQRVAARVKIDKLRSDVIPTAGIALDFESDLVNLPVLQVAEDGALIYQPGLNQDDEYVVPEAVLALDGADIGALATTASGNLSPLFASARAAGEFNYEPDLADRDFERPADIDRFTELPEEMPTGIGTIAQTRTEGATTDFERAWLLQYWFRDSGDFTYSTSVTTGSGSLDIAEWLTNPSSVNYRTGYCQQFAASMAVLGRSLGIPSRVVWGFTPGKVVTQSDGSEAVVVRDTNAHAWVEMWMDGFGWVKFDPTPRGGGVLPASLTAAFDPVPFLPAPNTPAVNPDINIFDSPNLQETEIRGGLEPGQTTFPWEWLIVVPLLLMAVGFLPWAKKVRRGRRLERLRQGDITSAWDEIVDRLTDLGQPIPSSDTPLEFAQRTDEALLSLAVNYSAAVYGDRNGMATESDLAVVEDWLRRRYEAGQRARAAFNPKSFLKKD